MALNWNWNEKCGELTVTQKQDNGESEDITISLYTGNAFLIMLQEFEEDGVEKYDMFSFWLDKQHMKNCLGLAKGTTNIYDKPWQTITKLRLNKKKCRHLKEIAAAMAAAFDSITIETYTEEE